VSIVSRSREIERENSVVVYGLIGEQGGGQGGWDANSSLSAVFAH
jgi:hypothetical protein